MKTYKKLMFTLLTLALIATQLLSSCKENSSVTPDSSMKLTDYAIANDTLDCSCLVNPSDEITQEEIDMLLYMREEEKLARDVYTTLSAQYTLPVFSNISKSEQVHMDKILCLLVYYNIDDPASTEIGIFSNPELQDLYDSLIEQGSVSLIDALTVGATIEDVDIFDLEEYINLTENEAIITIFEHLACGSGNHMRAFNALLDKNGIDYTPQFLSQEIFDEVIASEHTRCGIDNQQNNNGCVKDPAELTEQEIEMLKYMREEEKLARDVYTALSEQNAMPIFKNIAKSEQVHMDRVLCILDYYEIEDPASDEYGVFNNPDLQELYNALIEQGSLSLNDALTVGATIEDVDIYDLEESMESTVNSDILRVFGSLSCASGNHLRSFTTILTKRGVTYTPQYLSQEDYDAIISTDYSFCGNN